MSIFSRIMAEIWDVSISHSKGRATKGLNFSQTALFRDTLEIYDPALRDGDSFEKASIDFFSGHSDGLGFFSSRDIPAVIAAYAHQNDQWRSCLLAEVSQNCYQGLAVYSAKAKPLNDQFFWSTDPEWAHKDRLFRLRPHRFGFLPRLAVSACFNAEPLPILLSTLENWVAHVENGGFRAAYSSNLVVVYRIMAISWSAPFLVYLARAGNKIASEICISLLKILAADVEFFMSRTGRSAPNNHLLADRFGAWFLAACYPDFSPAADCQDLERIWIEELGRQFQSDGTNFEQSTHYHELGCEMAMAYLIVSLRQAHQPSAPAIELIERILHFQAALADIQGNPFAIGDATEDPLLPLDSNDFCGPGTWRNLYHALFDPSYPTVRDHAYGAEKAYWLLAALDQVELPIGSFPGASTDDDLTVFRDNGFCIFDSTNTAQKVLFRTGPAPGQAVHVGHSMSDLLSVYWNAGGRRMLEPSGTYSYDVEVAQAGSGLSRPRDYFRGPSSHNGLVLSGHDPLGDTPNRFREVDSNARVETRSCFIQDGLSWAEGRLYEPGPLNGFRRGVLRGPGDQTIVYDRLPALPDDRPILSHWQFAPEVQLGMASPTKVAVEVQAVRGYLCTSGGVLTIECVSGQASPAGGWVSRQYGRVDPAPQLRCTIGNGSMGQAYIFGLLDGNRKEPSVDVVVVNETQFILKTVRGSQQTIICVGPSQSAREDLSIDLSFKGQILWLGFEDNICQEVIALDICLLRSKDLNINVSAAEISANPPFETETWRLKRSSYGGSGICAHWERRSTGE